MARFLAIFAIIGLGVGFFVGLKVCRPAMVQIGSKFVDGSAFYDYQLLSTLGLTEEDRDYFAQMDSVLAVEGSMTADLLTSVNNRQLVYKTHQLLDNMNQVQLTAGRMPEAPDECLADDLKFSADDLGLVLTVENEDDDELVFSQKSYTIVGLCNSPQYLNVQRGTTGLANGMVEGFLYIPAGGYEADYFTELYVRLACSGAAFSSEYKEEMDNWEDPLMDALEERGTQRKEELVSEAQAELDDAWAEFEDGKQELEDTRAEVNAEIADAEAELADAEIKLADAKEELADGEQTLKELEEDPTSNEEIAEARKELRKGWGEFYDGQDAYEQGVKDYEKAYAEAMPELEKAKAELDDAKAQLDVGYAEYEKALQMMPAAMLQGEKNKLDAAKAEYEAGLAEYEAGVKQLDDAKAELDQAKVDLNEAQEALWDGEWELQNAIDDAITEAREELDKGWKEVEDAEAELADAQTELADLMAAAPK